MGNEMGNNNTTGFQEEHNASVEADQKSAVESPLLVNDVKGEKYQNGTVLASDDPKGVGDGHGDTLAYDQKSVDGKVAQKTEGVFPVESLKVDEKLNQEGSENGDLQIADSMSKELEDHKNIISSENISEISNDQTENSKQDKQNIIISSENVSEISNDGTENSKQDNQNIISSENDLEISHGQRDDSKQSLFEKEEEDMLNSTCVGISPSHDPESDDSAEPKSGQHESTNVYDDKSEEDGTNSLQGMENVLRSNTASNGKENGHMSDKIEEIIVSDTNIDMGTESDSLLQKEMEIVSEVGNEDVKEKCDGVSDSKIDSLESQLDAVAVTDSLDSNSEGKCMALDQESELMRNEPEWEENKLDNLDSDRESETDMKTASQTDSLTRPTCNGSLVALHDAAINGHCNFEEVKSVVEESEDKNEASEEYLEESEDKNEASKEYLDGSEGEIMMDNESRKDGMFITNAENHEKESGDGMPEADAAVDADGDGNFQVLEENSAEEPDNQNEASDEGKIEMVLESGITEANSCIPNGESNEEESGDCKSDASEGKTDLYPQPAKVTTESPIESEKEMEDIKAEEEEEEGEEPGEKQIQEIGEKTETLCIPVSTHPSENNQQKPEQVEVGSSEFFPTTASVFQTASSPVETFVSTVELEQEKPAGEGLPNVAEANSSTSASANHCIEQPENVEISAPARNGKDPIPGSHNVQPSTIKSIVSAAQNEESPLCSTTVAENQSSTEQFEKSEKPFSSIGHHERQESVGRFSTESIPDILNIHTEMRKSPSFNLNLRTESRSEESDMTPLLYQDKNTVEVISNQNSHLRAQNDEESVKSQEMPEEEKAITLERSDSEKSRTPFLGFLKEDEEPHHVVVIPQKEEKISAAKKGNKDEWNPSCNKGIKPNSAKSKEKHKRRSSLFTNCMCCTTVIN